jgi:hypothetical protein
MVLGQGFYTFFTLEAISRLLIRVILKNTRLELLNVKEE